MVGSREDWRSGDVTGEEGELGKSQFPNSQILKFSNEEQLKGKQITWLENRVEGRNRFSDCADLGAEASRNTR